MTGKKTTPYLALIICLLALSATTMTGCAYFTEERLSEIRRTVATALEIACESGGKELAAAKIDELVAEGKITAEQGEMLKQALQKSYEAFCARLKELSEPAE